MVDCCDLSTKMWKFTKDTNKDQGARRTAYSTQFGMKCSQNLHQDKELHKPVKSAGLHKLLITKLNPESSSAN